MPAHNKQPPLRAELVTTRTSGAVLGPAGEQGPPTTAEELSVFLDPAMVPLWCGLGTTPKSPIQAARATRAPVRLARRVVLIITLLVCCLLCCCLRCERWRERQRKAEERPLLNCEERDPWNDGDGCRGMWMAVGPSWRRETPARSPRVTTGTALTAQSPSPGRAVRRSCADWPAGARFCAHIEAPTVALHEAESTKMSSGE